MKIKYLGHSCFFIENQNTRIIIDPFFDENEFNPKPTHVVVTHGHSDHLGHAEKLCKNGAKFIATFELCNYMLSKKVKNVNAMHIGGFVDFETFQLKFVFALHSSSIDGIHDIGIATGVILKIGNKILYHAGDTGLFGDMKLIGERHNIDIAFLPIGGHFTMDIKDALYATKLLRPKMVVPMHYNTFPSITQNPKEFINNLPHETKGIIFEIGEQKESL